MLHVTVATAEPYGAYHLAPLDQATFERAGVALTQWLPGAGAAQHPGWVPTTRRVDVLAHTDLVVVAGGTATPWTSTVAAAAHRSGLPVTYVEFGWPSARSRFTSPIDTAAAGSAATAATVAALTGTSPTLYGRPGAAQQSHAKHAQQPQAPTGRRCLLLPIVTCDTPDRQAHLRAVAATLADDGWKLRVAQHLREPAGTWADVAYDITDLPAERQTDGVSLAVGTSTSRMLTMVAAHIPVLRVACGRADVDEHPLLAACGPTVTATTVAAAARRTQTREGHATANTSDRGWLLGPSDPSSRLARLLHDTAERHAAARAH